MTNPLPPPLSLAAGTVLDVEDPVRVVEIAAEAGYPSVGLRLDPERTSGTTIQRISQALTWTGLTLLDIEVARLRPGSGLDEPTRKLADLAGELGAHHLLTVGLDADPAATAAALEALAERLTGSPTSPALEFMGFTAVPSLLAAVEIARRLRPAARGQEEARRRVPEGAAARRRSPGAADPRAPGVWSAPLPPSIAAERTPDGLLSAAIRHRA